MMIPTLRALLLRANKCSWNLSLTASPCPSVIIRGRIPAPDSAPLLLLQFPSYCAGPRQEEDFFKNICRFYKERDLYYTSQMCSTTGTGHFAHLVQKTTGSCSKPVPGSAAEPVKVPRRAEAENIIAEGKPRGQDAMAVKMQPADDPPGRERLLQRISAMEGILNETFCAVSALKNAYIQLQAAHIPYDAERLQTADRAVIQQMKRLSELKEFYKQICISRRAEPHQQSQPAAGGGTDSCADDLALSRSEAVPSKGSEIETLDDVLESVQRVSKFETLKDALENVRKGSEFESPKDIVANASGRLDRKAKRSTAVVRHHNNNNIIINNVIYSKRPNSVAVGHQYSAPTGKLFEATVQKMKESARAFTKCLICLMKSAGWDLDAAARSIEPGIRYAKRCHKKLAFRSYVCLRMFEGFEIENFCQTGGLMAPALDAEARRNECFCQFQAMLQTEPMQLLSITPDCPFGKFCRKKFLHIVHPKMEESFFGGFEHRNLIVNGGHPRSQFYGVFLQLAKCAWLVHRLALSFDPAIAIFHAKRGADFHDSHMENLNTPPPEGANLVRFVGFTVMPGFRFGNRALVRCQVYLTDDPICT